MFSITLTKVIHKSEKLAMKLAMKRDLVQHPFYGL